MIQRKQAGSPPRVDGASGHSMRLTSMAQLVVFRGLRPRPPSAPTPVDPDDASMPGAGAPNGGRIAIVIHRRGVASNYRQPSFEAETDSLRLSLGSAQPAGRLPGLRSKGRVPPARAPAKPGGVPRVPSRRMARRQLSSQTVQGARAAGGAGACPRM